MLFNSTLFLYVFLPVTYFVFWRLRSKGSRYVWLTLTGYAFYAAWNWKFCFLMAFSTVVSFTAGLGLRRNTDPRIRRLYLIVPILVDLLLLGFFKYFNFALATAESTLNWFGVSWHAPLLNIVLPIGISFYTFHTISYIVDAYRGDIEPTSNFFEFSCYVSLFSQLVAGPIVRFRQIEEDLERIDHGQRSEWLDRGWSFFAIGMIQKVLIADTIAGIIDPALQSYSSLTPLAAWGCALGYAYQLYFDFAGYSNMAVGLGQMFGIRIPQNFNSPYKSVSIGDFWRRWHMSLSSCLRDYVYIPLGGNRGGEAFVRRNLLLTMLIGGLWHGANWTFVVWGAYHGVLLIINRRWNEQWEQLPKLVQQAITFLLVVVGWVFFRSTDLSMASSLLQKMAWLDGGDGSARLGMLLVPAIGIAAVIAHTGRNTFEMSHQWRRQAVVGWSVLWIAALARIVAASPSPFLYFQF